MKKRFLFCCLICLLSVNLVHAQKRGVRNEKPKVSDVKTVYKHIQDLFDQYLFEDAIDEIQQEIDKATSKRKKDINVDSLTALQNKAEANLQILRGTEKVMFIDSFVVDKSKILELIKIDPENGTIGPYSQFFETNSATTDQTSIMAYMSGLGDKIYFSDSDNKHKKRLYYSSHLTDGKWDKPVSLPGLTNNDASQINPYVLSDGTTLYYAAQNEESMGGYDIFVTRYSSEHGAYLKPENLGMPFNSPANDYLYVIDEINQLGWFVTDRNQPTDKVCIYVFIPNKTRITYLYEEGEDNRSICNAARIASIANTWYDKTAVAEAKKRLKQAMEYKALVKEKNSFYFVINDTHIYTQPQQFKSSDARKNCQTWLEMTERMNLLNKTLDKLRNDYASQEEEQRNNMKRDILKMESESETLYTNIMQMENKIRTMELKSLDK